MTGLVFVDSNVLLYAQDARLPEKQAAARDWLATLWRTRTGRLSTQVLHEFFVSATQKLEPRLTEAAAWEYAQTFFAWHPRALDADITIAAREVMMRHRIGWWDALIVAAARAEQCSLLLSEDLPDGAVYGGVTVRDPFRMTLSEATAHYAAQPRAASVHRPRGRPRRATA